MSFNGRFQAASWDLSASSPSQAAVTPAAFPPTISATPSQTSPAPPPSPPVSSPALVQQVSTSIPSQANSGSSGTQDSENSYAGAAPAKATESTSPQASPSQAEATRDGVTQDGAHQDRGQNSGGSPTPILTPTEISPPWKTAMVCVSAIMGWSPYHLETGYLEIVSKAKREEVGTFISTKIRGPPVCSTLSTNSDNKAAFVEVSYYSTDPSKILWIYISRGKADAPTRSWVTKASVEHVLSRDSKTCPLWVTADADGYLRPCCEKWYACVGFSKPMISPHEVLAFMLWVLDNKDAAHILKTLGFSAEAQAELWRWCYRHERQRNASGTKPKA